MRGFQARGSVAQTPPPTGQPAFAYRVYIGSEDGDLYALYQGQEKQTAVTYRPETASYKQLKIADKPGKEKKRKASIGPYVCSVLFHACSREPAVL